MTVPLINDNLSYTITSIVYLLYISPENPEKLPPTCYALTTALKLVIQAYEQMGDSFPPAWADTDNSGGITLTWSNENEDRIVTLLCPATSEQFADISESVSNEYYVDDLFSNYALFHSLNQFNE